MNGLNYSLNAFRIQKVIVETGFLFVYLLKNIC